MALKQHPKLSLEKTYIQLYGSIYFTWIKLKKCISILHFFCLWISPNRRKSMTFPSPWNLNIVVCGPWKKWYYSTAEWKRPQKDSAVRQHSLTLCVTLHGFQFQTASRTTFRVAGHASWQYKIQNVFLPSEYWHCWWSLNRVLLFNEVGWAVLL